MAIGKLSPTSSVELLLTANLALLRRRLSTTTLVAA